MKHISVEIQKKEEKREKKRIILNEGKSTTTITKYGWVIGYTKVM